MIRFRRIFDVASYLGKDSLAQVTHIYQKAFDYYPNYSEKIAKYLKNQVKYNYEIVLIAAEGRSRLSH